MSRRALLAAAAGGAGALSLGVAPPSASAAATFIKGADISWMPQMEANGFWWNNASGVRQDLLTILKGYGMTAVRLRTWVNPSSDPANGHCSIQETAAAAVRCKNAGLQVMISLHFGDTWNSVGRQVPPAAWAAMTYPQMRQAMYDYVYNAMNILKYHGVAPAWVAIGNETNSGICQPVGSLSRPAQMTGLLMAAHEMAKLVFPATQVLLHLAQPQNLARVQAFLDAYRAHGGQWDITGLSSYAAGPNVAPVLANMRTIQSQYGKPIWHVEAGGPVNRAAATKASLKEMLAGLKAMGALGSLYWEPQGYAPFTDYGMTAWDAVTRRPTIALDAFKEA